MHETTLELFARAVRLIGGQEAAARALGISDRSLRYLLAGKRTLHAGHLEDMGKLLLAHADQCRALERRISPAFAGNLGPDVGTPHGNSAHARRQRGD